MERARAPLGTQVRAPTLEVRRCPLPREAPAVGPEASHDARAGVDAREREVPAQLLGPPAVQHRLEHLRRRIDEPDTVHHVQMGRAAYFDLSLHAIPLSQLMIDSINRCEQRCGYPGQAATHQPS